jgi:hypothetical protein
VGTAIMNPAKTVDPVAAPRFEKVSANAKDGLTFKAGEPPGWDYSGDFPWFMANFCTIDSSIDYCNTDLVSFSSAIRVVKSIRGSLFNQDFLDTSAYYTIMYDPCYGAPVWDFCTKPFKSLETLRPSPRWVFSSSVWKNKDNSKNRYASAAQGVRIGVYNDFD